MIDSIKQKLTKLNPREPTNLKKAGVLIAILKSISTHLLLFTPKDPL